MLHRTVKKNDVNKDKWIGVGGHFEEGESPEECVCREVREETGYTLTSYQYRGLVTFVSGDGMTEYMSLFIADGFEGEPAYSAFAIKLLHPFQSYDKITNNCRSEDGAPHRSEVSDPTMIMTLRI